MYLESDAIPNMYLESDVNGCMTVVDSCIGNNWQASCTPAPECWWVFQLSKCIRKIMPFFNWNVQSQENLICQSCWAGNNNSGLMKIANFSPTTFYILRIWDIATEAILDGIYYCHCFFAKSAVGNCLESCHRRQWGRRTGKHLNKYSFCIIGNLL